MVRKYTHLLLAGRINHEPWRCGQMRNEKICAWSMNTYRTVADVTKIQSQCKQCSLRQPINVLHCNWMLPKRRPHIFDDSPICLSRRCDHLSVQAAVDIGSLQEDRIQQYSGMVLGYYYYRFSILYLFVDFGRDDNMCQCSVCASEFGCEQTSTSWHWSVPCAARLALNARRTIQAIAPRALEHGPSICWRIQFG